MVGVGDAFEDPPRSTQDAWRILPITKKIRNDLTRAKGPSMFIAQSHWGLEQLPFASTQPSLYYPAGTHEEALARLHYVVDQGRPACLMRGDSGSGRTFLARLQARLTREQGLASGYVNLRAATPSRLLELLADSLAVAATPQPYGPTELTHMLQARALERGRLVLAFDDADLASPETLELLRAILDDCGPHVSSLFACRTASAGRVHHRFAGLSELTVTLEPWTLDDTIGFLHAALLGVGGELEHFQPSAVERIWEQSAGRPGEIARLARLSLLAGAGDDVQQIDCEIVDSVVETLL